MMRQSALHSEYAFIPWKLDRLLLEFKYARLRWKMRPAPKEP